MISRVAATTVYADDQDEARACCTGEPGSGNEPMPACPAGSAG
jgi:hypothetical protein